MSSQHSIGLGIAAALVLATTVTALPFVMMTPALPSAGAPMSTSGVWQADRFSAAQASLCPFGAPTSTAQANCAAWGKPAFAASDATAMAMYQAPPVLSGAVPQYALGSGPVLRLQHWVQAELLGPPWERSDRGLRGPH